MAVIDALAVPLVADLGDEEDNLRLTELKSSGKSFNPITVELSNPHDSSVRSVSKQIESSLLQCGFQATSSREDLKDQRREESRFLYIIEGFMGVGLFVGIAASGGSKAVSYARAATIERWCRSEPGWTEIRPGRLLSHCVARRPG